MVLSQFSPKVGSIEKHDVNPKVDNYHRVSNYYGLRDILLAQLCHTTNAAEQWIYAKQNFRRTQKQLFGP